MCYTGGLWEHDFCGRVASIPAEKPQYKPWKASASEVVKRFTEEPETNPAKWDVSDPDGLCSDLFYFIAVNLKLDNMQQLAAYPCFGTAIDLYHGVDLFFVYRDRMCTVDLTVNTHKDSYKADVIVSPDDDLEEVAKTVAARLSY